MTCLALLAPLLPAKIDSAVQMLPQFKPRWWYRRERLDARPVIWSLDHRPEEWKLNYRGEDYENLLHLPSGHSLYSAPNILMGRLVADCSCRDRQWQIFQVFGVRRAIRRWQSAHGGSVTLADQFRGHFIRE